MMMSTKYALHTNVCTPKAVENSSKVNILSFKVSSANEFYNKIAAKKASGD